MTRRQSLYRGRGGSSRGNLRPKSYEAALRHIKEAEELSEELGGTDKDVKEYFFTLDENELSDVLDEYEHIHGKEKREYADFAMPLWRSRRRKMSGCVAGRLFSLLPKRMPLHTKYSMVETLWKRYSPRTNKKMIVGPLTDEEQVLREILDHLSVAVQSYVVPLPLKRRFDWLAGSDVSAHEELLNHFLARDQELAAGSIRLKLPVCLKHLRESARHMQRLSQMIEVGGHRVELIFVPHKEARTHELPSALSPTKGPEPHETGDRVEGYWAVGIVVITLVLLVIFNA